VARVVIKMKIKIVPLYGLEAAYKENKTANVISIRDTYPTKNNRILYRLIDSHVDNLYVLCMDDIVDYKDVKELLNSFPFMQIPSKNSLSQLIDWCKIKLEQDNDFIIHCTAGVSRSPAIAILVQCLITPTDISKIASVIDYELHSPNKLILRLTGELLGIQGLENL